MHGRVSHRLLSVTILLLALRFHAGCVRGDDWPQWLGPLRDGIWRESRILERFPSSGPRIRWRTPIGAGYSGPVVAEGRVYLTDRPTTRDKGTPSGPVDRAAVPGVERVLCLDEADGRVLWQHEYDRPYNIAYPSGPRACPLVAGGKVTRSEPKGICAVSTRLQAVWSGRSGSVKITGSRPRPGAWPPTLCSMGNA